MAALRRQLRVPRWAWPRSGGTISPTASSTSGSSRQAAGPVPRLFVAALTSAVDRSPLHSTKRLRRLMITDIPPETHLTYDGEVAKAPGRLLLDKQHEALTVYRPLES